MTNSFAHPATSRREESAGRQHSEYIPKKLSELNLNQGPSESEASNHTAHETATENDAIETDRPGSKTDADKKCGLCVALYDFHAENAGELGFKEGQTLKLYDKIDENWYEGALESPEGEQTGIFPTNYVRVTQPIPNQSNISANGN